MCLIIALQKKRFSLPRIQFFQNDLCSNWSSIRVYHLFKLVHYFRQEFPLTDSKLTAAWYYTAELYLFIDAKETLWRVNPAKKNPSQIEGLTY